MSRRRRLAFAAAGVVALAGLANLEVSTRQGVNFEVTEHSCRCI